MILFLIAYLAGALTILSPCILPVLPFVFARAEQPFVRSGLPLLAGMALTFAGVATLAAVGGGWAVQANQAGRWIALLVMAVLGLTLIFPALADRLTRPLVALGSRLTERASREQAEGRSSIWPSFLLGVATGLLWAPCAGPILGLILTGAALQGASVGTTVLLAAYAAGAATSLALALLVGGRVFQTMKRSLGVGEWVRKGLGVLVLIGVVAIALGLDTGLLTRLSAGGVNRFEQGLLSQAGVGQPRAQPRAPVEALPIEMAMPPLTGATGWLNSPPITTESLKGKVVLFDFWTYSCINCVRTLPYVRAWADKYRDQGLVVIGVHTPEFAFEKSQANVRDAIRRFGVTYPVALDNEFGVWRAFQNQYWPAHYFIDAAGNVRYHHFGEGDYDHSERVIQQLLREAGHTDVPTDLVDIMGQGAEAPPGATAAGVRSPETYLGYARAANMVSPRPVLRDAVQTYEGGRLTLNQWSLSGDWTVRGEHADLARAGGTVTYRFRGRDLHLVMGLADPAKPVRFRIRIDGRAPGPDAGVDVNAAGEGVVDSQRLYQLVRQARSMGERTFEIEFLDPGVQAFAFTFG
ncbi:cytochrome C biogenesis protein [Brevundimonas sp. Leaf363]|uniref:cytochrome c biogenesis protein DipZ n=1 Tax=Brevundimonas sp. Leaf363 TaxID=1736353 RepID=UPI0006F60305|nr:cytochrome c biogenesis protein DipZ [Brevundimonas sp. Leaf363]KQS54249.1 cytochrome C biogenesis protein [Brevundimonas sp. Leaf363]